MAPATAISPADGPVVVTGAAGYIGVRIVEDCVTQGYVVRACVRDKGNSDKVAHLLALNNRGLRGRVELFEADLSNPGSYDGVFKGAAGVVHAGAAVGFNKETPQQVYDGCFTEVKHLIESVKKSGSVRRFVFTSSYAAVHHPRPAGYIYSEKDWCGDNRKEGSWTADLIPKNLDASYAMAKAATEKHMYAEAEGSQGAWEALAINPLHVVGPLMCANHNQPGSWQNCILRMMNGRPHPRGGKGGRMLWNCVDVRDTARAHRLCLEVPTVGNGCRFILSASDREGELETWRLQDMLQAQFPQLKVGGEERGEDGQPVKPTFDAPRSYCLLARQALGLRTHSIEETVRATGESYLRLGLVKTAEAATAAAKL